jgi:hypothetical protein
VLDDVRRDPGPDIDWDTLEDALMAKVSRQSASTRAHRGHYAAFSVKWAFAFAAMCALGVGYAATRSPTPPAPIVTTTAPAPAAAVVGRIDGNGLAVGQSITASTDDVVVEHARRVTWTLEPGSLAHLESVGDVVTVALDRGVVSARVVKSLRTETFVVRVDDTRIAVHGTEFRVERLASGVQVRVTEGVLGIGPVGGPSFELRAPGAATLNLHGARADKKPASLPAHRIASGSQPPAEEAVPAPAEGAETAPPGTPAPAVDAPVAAAVTAENTAPRRATMPAGAEPLVAQTAHAVQTCFATRTLASGDVQVSVRTHMSLRVTVDGHVGDALFDPPLAPSVRDCVDTAVGGIVFPRSAEGFAVDKNLELSH